MSGHVASVPTFMTTQGPASGPCKHGFATLLDLRTGALTSGRGHQRVTCHSQMPQLPVGGVRGWFGGGKPPYEILNCGHHAPTWPSQILNFIIRLILFYWMGGGEGWPHWSACARRWLGRRVSICRLVGGVRGLVGGFSAILSDDLTTGIGGGDPAVRLVRVVAGRHLDVQWSPRVGGPVSESRPHLCGSLYRKWGI